MFSFLSPPLSLSNSLNYFVPVFFSGIEVLEADLPVALVFTPIPFSLAVTMKNVMYSLAVRYINKKTTVFINECNAHPCRKIVGTSKYHTTISNSKTYNFNIVIEEKIVIIFHQKILVSFLIHDSRYSPLFSILH